MKLLIPLLLFASSVFAQDPCEDFLNLMGRAENSEELRSYLEECGSFNESASSDGQTKTLSSAENGTTMTLTNTQKDQSLTPEFQLTVIELNSSSGSGGYKGSLPLGFRMDMDPFMVKDHIKQHKELSYDRSEVGIRRSYTNYSGPVNDAVEDKQVRIYISQYDKRSITIFRLRLR